MTNKWGELSDAMENRMLLDHQSRGSLLNVVSGGVVLTLLAMVLNYHALRTECPSALAKAARLQGLSLPAVTTGEVYEAGLYAGFACTAGLIGILILSWVRGMAPPASVHLLSRVAVLGLRLVYVAATVIAYLSNATHSHGASFGADVQLVGVKQWSLEFCLCSMTLSSFGNGLSTRVNCALLTLVVISICPLLQGATTCAAGGLPSSEDPAGVFGLMRLAGMWNLLAQALAGIPAFVSASRSYILIIPLSLYISKLETASVLSGWISLQLVEMQRQRLTKILRNLLPKDVVHMVLSRHFQEGTEALPVKAFRERRAVVLHLDLKNYTGLTRSLDKRELASHIDKIFTRFDLLVTEKEAVSLGVFKIDTIGDAYEAAAWLSDGTCEAMDDEANEEQQMRDIDVAHKMHAIGWAMIAAVKSYSEQTTSKIECRVGLSSGQVLAGMLGKLSPRFHLMGEAVWASHKLEAAAAVNTVKLGENLQLMVDSFSQPRPSA